MNSDTLTKDTDVALWGVNHIHKGLHGQTKRVNVYPYGYQLCAGSITPAVVWNTGRDYISLLGPLVKIHSRVPPISSTKGPKILINFIYTHGNTPKGLLQLLRTFPSFILCHAHKVHIVKHLHGLNFAKYVKWIRTLRKTFTQFKPSLLAMM